MRTVRVVLSLPIRFPFYFSLSLVCRVRTRNWKRDFHISLVGCAATSFIHRFSLVSLPFISNTYSMTGCMSSIYSISACVTRTKFICESVPFEHTKFIFIIYQIFFSSVALHLCPLSVRIESNEASRHATLIHFTQRECVEMVGADNIQPWQPDESKSHSQTQDDDDDGETWHSNEDIVSTVWIRTIPFMRARLFMNRVWSGWVNFCVGKRVKWTKMSSNGTTVERKRYAKSDANRRESWRNPPSHKINDRFSSLLTQRK